MFLDQEIKFQAELRAEEMAKDMAQDMAKNMAKDLAQEKVIETAKKFLEMDLSPEQVSKGTNIPLEQVFELKKQMEAK